MGRHTALYLRISDDKNGRAEGVEVQERQGRAYAAQAWPDVPVVVYCDNDLTAARDDVVRPEYEQLRQAIRDGLVAHVWCVEQSRLERREVGWFELAAELDAAGIGEVHTNRDGVVRVHDEVAGIKAVLAAAEVRRLKKRLRDRLDDNASQGRPPGSRPFGFAHALDEAGGKTYAVVEVEAAAIRWAAERVLAGWSLSSIAAALTAKGLTGAHRVKVKDAAGEVVTDEQGNPVTRPGILRAGSVRKMVTNPSVAGFRVHRGEIIGRGNWPAILDEAAWRACRSKLSAPRVVERTDGGTYPVASKHTGFSGRKYVLTGGLAVCGVCGAPLVGSMKQVNGPKKLMPYLLCHPSRGGRACVGIMLDATEQHVIDRLFAELDKPEFLDAIAEDPHAGRREQIETELAAIDGQRRELAELWGARKLNSGEWAAAKAAIDAHERALRTEWSQKPPPPARVDIAQARASWPDMELGEQRQFVRTFVERVTVSRAAMQGRKGFDDRRVEITWKVADVPE